MTDTKKLLLEFSSKTGVAGLESEAAGYGKDLLEKYGEVTLSPLGSVICTVQKPKNGELHIMLDAHIDEIGMVVAHIGDKGFLRAGGCGGIDRRLLMASPVTVHNYCEGRNLCEAYNLCEACTQNGGITGVICSTPPHLNKDCDKKNKKVEEIYIDIGAEDKEEAEKLVRLGDRITLNSRTRELLNGLVSGKALDDRAGCVSLLKALEYLDLKKKPLGCGLSVVFSTMEEVGGQGAKTAAYSVDPTHALAVDVSFAYTPDSQKEKCGEIKKGPMIGFAPILEAELSNMLVRLAERDEIPHQCEVMGSKTSTNADAIAVSRGGVRTALLSIPQKYMHTPVETVAVEDVENTGRLIAAFVREIAEAAKEDCRNG